MIDKDSRAAVQQMMRKKPDSELCEMVLDHAGQLDRMAEEAYKLGFERHLDTKDNGLLEQAMETSAFMLCVSLELRELHRRLMNATQN